MKIFDIYETKDVVVEDLGLRRVINLDERLVLKSHGRHAEKFGKVKVNVLERLTGALGVPGHRGKKHKIQKLATGKYSKNMKIVLDALKIIEEKTKQNPIQIVIKAIENSAPRDGVTVIEYGGARYPQAVDLSPLRRLNLALRHLVHGGFDKAFNKKTNIAQGLAQEIILASENNNDSFSVQRKTESEKQAVSAR